MSEITVPKTNPSDKLHTDARLRLNEINRDVAEREANMIQLEKDFQTAMRKEQDALDDEKRIARAWEAMITVFEGNGPVDGLDLSKEMGE